MNTLPAFQYQDGHTIPVLVHYKRASELDHIIHEQEAWILEDESDDEIYYMTEYCPQLGAITHAKFAKAHLKSAQEMSESPIYEKLELTDEYVSVEDLERIWNSEDEQ